MQNQYAPVYRHRSFEFGAAQTAGDRIAQRVQIIDANGEAWEALYTLERQSGRQFEDHRLFIAEGRSIGVIARIGSATVT